MPLRLIEAIQQRVAVIAIGPSTARGQGVPGVVLAAQSFLSSLDLRRFATSDESVFRSALEMATQELKDSLPDGGRSWGMARKGLNIFLRDAFYTHYLRDAFGLAASETLHEVPLDSIVAKALRRSSSTRLPRWPGVKYLTPELSEIYQKAALDLSAKMGIARVHLDTYLWVAGRAGQRPAPIVPLQPV